MPKDRLEQLQEQQRGLTSTVKKIAVEHLKQSDHDSDSDNTAYVTSPSSSFFSRLTRKTLFQSDKKPAPNNQQAGSQENFGNRKFLTLQKFCMDLRMIGSNYKGKNPRRLEIIKQIRELAERTPVDSATAREQLVNLATEIRNLLAEVTKDHRKGFFAYLFGTKCRLERLILACFNPLVKTQFLKLTKEGIEVLPEKTGPRLGR